MSTTLTIRNIDPSDKSWLKRTARHHGVSMEQYVRQLIYEKRQKMDDRPKPSEVFARYFGEESGIEHLPLPRYSYRPLQFSEQDDQ